MRLEWLEDLLAVVETGSFTEAASRRHLTQSAFSRRIRSIEDHVGVELFDRTRKPVQLRPGTLDQHDRIRQVAQTLRQLALDLKRGGLGLENRIVLASQHALTTSLTPALVQRIQALPGNIRVRLRSANLDECFGLLLACQADIALVYRAVGEEHPIEADYIETLEIGAERLIPIHSSVDRDRLDAQLEGGGAAGRGLPGRSVPGTDHEASNITEAAQRCAGLATCRDRTDACGAGADERRHRRRLGPGLAGPGPNPSGSSR
jgi:LysR family transcriptional regulator, hypochlorite-specific transcription factor HypT